MGCSSPRCWPAARSVRFRAASGAGCAGLYARAARAAHRGGRDGGRQRAALRARSRPAGAMVDAVSFQGAQRPGREGARRQSLISRPRRRAAGRARERPRPARRAVPDRSPEFRRHPLPQPPRPDHRQQSVAPTFNLFTGQLNISYSPDVFGGTRRSIEALAAQEDSQRFALEATYLTLTSNLAGAAVQEAALRGQIAATLSIIKIETDVRVSEIAWAVISAKQMWWQGAAIEHEQFAMRLKSSLWRPLHC